MKVLGMISGTSFDGIDAAVVEFTPDGDGLTASVLAGETIPYADGLADAVAAALPPAPTSMEQVCKLDNLIGHQFADVAANIANSVGGVDLVATHGQTIFHWVDGGVARGTLQIGEPAWIAEKCGTPVLSNIRIADIAAGGQGAPLVPILDTLVLGGLPGNPAALNLGGIANFTVLSAGAPLALDTGPANALIDAAVRARAANPKGVDVDGAIAASGRMDEELLANLLAEPYYALPSPKSTGKELFHAEYLAAALARHRTEISTPDLLATLVELTARTVTAQLRSFGVDLVIASGGGIHNASLMRALAVGLPDARLTTSDEFGLSADLKEAIAFALIGYLSALGLPGNVPACTGATRPVVLGQMSPGRDGYLNMPPGLMPHFVRMVTS